MGAGFTGQREPVFQGLGIAVFQVFFQLLQRLAEQGGLCQHFRPVRLKNVTPHFGVTGCNAGEITKAWPAQCEKVVGLHLRANAVHQRKCQQVRQVADGGKGSVVRFGRHVRDMAA